MSLRFDSSLPPAAPLAPPVRQMPVETVTAPTASAPPADALPPPPSTASTATAGHYASGFEPAGQTQFRGQSGAVQSSPAAGIADRVLDKSYLFRALSRAMDRFPGSPPPLLITGAAPVLSGIRAGAPPGAPPLPGTPARLEDVDTRNLASFSTVLASIDAQAKAGQLDPARRGGEIVAQALDLIDPEHKLNETMRKGLGEFLARLPPESLAQAEVQGAGGASAGHGVTGSGAAGQYVNSVISSLQQLTNSGRLDGKLLASLNLLTDAGRLDPTLRSQQGELIRSVLQDVAFPDKINQHSKATCAPTTVQIIFATRKPAEYVALVANLASEGGRALPQDAALDPRETIVREPGTEADDKSGRSLSNRLVQPAFIEFANGKDNNYDNASDKDSGGNSGLHISGTERLMKKLLGDDHRALMFNPSLSEGVDAVQEYTDKGHPITVGLNWGNDSHQVLVTKIDAQHKLAYFMNPWGELQTMGLDEFQKRLTCGVFPGKPGNSGPVMGTLPGAAAKPENYKPIDALRYFSAAEYLEKQAVLKDFFSADQRREIGYGLVVFKVPPSMLDALANSVKELGLPKSFATELVGRIKGTGSADELNKLLRVVNFAQYAVKKETIAPAQMNALLEAHPERNLPTEKFEALLTALNTGSAEKSLALAGEALARQLSVVPPAQQRALIARVLASPHDSTDNQAAAALKLAVHPEKTLAGEALAKAVNALAFGGPDPQEIPPLLAKAIGGSDMDAAQVKTLIQGYLKSNDSELAGNLLKAVRSEPRLAPVVTAFAKDLAHGVPKDFDVNFAKSLRQCLNGPETAKVAASLDKFLKGFGQRASYEPPELAAGAAPAATAAAPESDAPAAENPQAATDQALAARLPALIAQAAKKPQGERKAELAKLVLAEIDPGNKLKEGPAREAALNLLQQLPADAGLAAAEVQGAGGMDRGAGVTGSGKDGHYVNGMMTSLRQLIDSGRMTAGLAQSLSALSKADNLAPELQSRRDALLRSTLQDIAFPESINQHSKGTCAPTTTQIMLAVKNPTQYVDIMRGLASKDGQATGVENHEDANDNITRTKDTDQDDKSGRSLSSRLMQVALMEYGNGKDVTYDNVTDTHKDGKPPVPGKEDKGGLGSEGVHRILTKLFPDESYARLQHPPDDKDRLLQSIQAQVAKGHPVTVGMPWDESAHQVLVTGLDEQKKVAYLMNPWGELQTMPLDEFKEKVDSAVFPTKGDRGKPALALLPNAACRPESYKPLDPDRYYTATDILRKDPHLQSFFAADQIKALGATYQKLSLPLDSLRYLSAAIKKGKPPLEAGDIMRLLGNAATKEQAQRFVRMLAYATVGHESRVANFDAEQFKNLWAVTPKNGQTAAFEQIIGLLESKDLGKVREMMATRMGSNFQNQAMEDRGPYLRTMNVAKDPESQAFAQLILRAQPEKSLSPAELGQLAAGLAMRDFSGKPGEALAKLLGPQAERGSGPEAAATLKTLLQGGEVDSAVKLFEQLQRQGKPPMAQIATNLLKGFDEFFYQGMSRPMLETLRDNIKGSRDPDLQKQLAIIENYIKNMN